MHKSPRVYGSFPTDAYSHTPRNSGAQQPGMTGQVKEDIISRFAELGVQIEAGQLRFNPDVVYSISGEKQKIALQPGMLGFTLCQVPIVYIRGKIPGIRVTFVDKIEQTISGLKLPKDLSASLFNREGVIKKITVTFL